MATIALVSHVARTHLCLPEQTACAPPEDWGRGVWIKLRWSPLLSERPRLAVRAALCCANHQPRGWQAGNMTHLACPGHIRQPLNFWGAACRHVSRTSCTPELCRLRQHRRVERGASADPNKPREAHQAERMISNFVWWAMIFVEQRPGPAIDGFCRLTGLSLKCDSQVGRSGVPS